MIPGEVIVGVDPVGIPGGTGVTVTVVNTGDRPIQVGSHFHFADANSALQFPRELALGCHLAVPAGTSVRFEPGIERRVELVRYSGA